jgi:hypothetical protein
VSDVTVTGSNGTYTNRVGRRVQFPAFKHQVEFSIQEQCWRSVVSHLHSNRVYYSCSKWDTEEEARWSLFKCDSALRDMLDEIVRPHSVQHYFCPPLETYFGSPSNL